MARERQTHFGAGELAPTLHGRTDLRQYSSGAAVIRNFIVGPHGVLTNRTGAMFVAEGNGNNREGRLFAFTTSDGKPTIFYIVANQIRVRVRESTSDNPYAFTYTPYTVSHDISSDELSRLNFYPHGDRVLVTSPEQAPFWIEKAPDWYVEAVGAFGGTWRTSPFLFTTPAWPDDTSTGPRLIAVRRHATFDLEGDADFPPRPWNWQVSAVVRLLDGSIVETRGGNITVSIAPTSDPDEYDAGVIWVTESLPDEIAVYPEHPVEIYTGLNYGSGGVSLSPGNYIPAGVSHEYAGGTILSVKVYRGREGYFGLVGETSDSWFSDDGRDPDFSHPPPQSFDPFVFGDESDSNGYPIAASLFETRQVFGGSESKPGLIVASRQGEHRQFKLVQGVVPPADAPWSTEVGGTTKTEVRHLVPTDYGLIAFTKDEEYRLAGDAEGGAITPDKGVFVRSLNTKRGCAYQPQPIEVGGQVIFMEQKGVKPRSIIVSADGVQAPDLSYLSRHLFAGFSIVDWAYAEDPFQCLYVVRSDGALLVYTYLPEFGIAAWSRCDFAEGMKVIAVATAPEAHEDGVYVLIDDVERTTKPVFLARLAYKTLPPLPTSYVGEAAVPDTRYANYLDHSVIYNGKNTDEDQTVTLSEYSGGGWDLGATITVTFASSYTGNVNQLLQIDDPDDGPPIRIELTEEVNVTTYRAQIMEAPASDDEDTPNSVPDSFQDVAITSFWVCLSSITNTALARIAGYDVVIVADGAVIRGVSVVANSVALERPAAIAVVGLEYPCEFESLDEPQEKGREKIIEKVIVELEQTRGGKVGEALDDSMVDLPDRNSTDLYNVAAPKRVEAIVNVRASWTLKGRVAVAQTDPLPMTILGITRIIKYGG